MSIMVKTASIHPVFCAHGVGDDRHMGPIIGVFLLESDADAAQKGAGDYGGNGGTTTRKALILDKGGPTQRAFLLDRDFSDSIDLDVNLKDLNERLRKSALDKLTEAERKVLGM
jgi:hypothetical protein